MDSEVTPLLLRPQLANSLPWDPRRSRKAGILVLLSLTLERLAFYALVANLFLYLNLIGWSPQSAMTAVLVLVGTAHFSALIGGWMADGYFGRYWAIIFGLCFYIFGFGMLTAYAAGGLCESNSYTHSACMVEMYVILMSIGFAAGTVRANFPSFGAEQVRYGGPDSVRRFFNWYYWCVNSGSLIGVGALSFVAQDLSNGFLKTFASATGCIALSLILFACGRPYYLVHRPTGSVLLNILCIIKEGISGRCAFRMATLESSPVINRRNLINANQPSPSWLDYAKIRYGGTYHDAAVEDVKRLGTVLLLFASLMPYWLVFFQIETGFQEQGVHLKIGFAEKNGVSYGFNMPTAWLSLFDQIFILALIPMMNTLIYPLLDKWGIQINLLVRIAIGMGFSMLSAVSAGILEFLSLRRWSEGFKIEQIIHNTKYNASDISLLWQIPQYCLVGTAEVFSGVAGLEFAYSAAPRPLQGVVMGIFATMEGLSSLLGTALINALSPVWIRKDFQHFQGHLDYYFFLLASIQCVALVIFIVYLLIQKRRRRRSEMNIAEDVQ